LEIGRNDKYAVYEDRLKIWNPAVLPEGWTLENLLADHASTPYHPALATAFFRAGEIETWGRGIQRIFEAYENAGTPAPIIDYKPNDLWLEFPFSPKYLKAIRQGEEGAPPSKVGEKVGKTSGKIIALMGSNDQITIPELAAAIGISDRSVERTIRKLQQDGRLRRIGPAKGDTGR
jgi:ATP-dependent DNA helicase RecG